MTKFAGRPLQPEGIAGAEPTRYPPDAGADPAISSDPAGDGRLNAAIRKGLDWLDRSQHDEGFWSGKLQSSYCIEAEWLLAMHIIGYEHPRKQDLARTLLAGQREDGAWESYYRAPTGDINSTVECYAGLRSIGMPADAEPLVRARKWILANGGLSGVRVFTRYWLALIGEWPWPRTPNLPPEIIFCPKWLPFNIYRFAAWARATLLPLAILSARRTVKPLPADRRLDELFPHGRNRVYRRRHRRLFPLSWEGLFLLADRLAHWLQNMGMTPFREVAIRRCLRWIVDHQDDDGAWGGIQPPWIYSLIALHAEGRGLKDGPVAKGLAALDAHWTYRRGGMLHIQASESSVWDTLLSLLAMQECGRRHSVGMDAALHWILDRQQLDVVGDWGQRIEGVEPGGWPFERANRHYPDVDDTAVALLVLARLPEPWRSRSRVRQAIERGLRWILAMQCSNGGWGAFDKDNETWLLARLPFCDFGEVLDPPSADVTAHVLEALGHLGCGLDHPSVARGHRFLLAEQEKDGSWFGRWGVNHIYGTAAVLPALRAIGADMSAVHVKRAARWMVEHQNGDGGWGETCASYVDDRLRGKGPSTASQSAWALLALLAVSADAFRIPIERGLRYLVDTQRRDGTWDEPHYTGTGFPGYGVGARAEIRNLSDRKRIAQGAELQRAFMINYNLYRHYFPLIAMGRALSSKGISTGNAVGRHPLAGAGNTRAAAPVRFGA